MSEPVIPVPISFAACHAAWLKARRGKRPSADQLRFNARWLDNLLALHDQLRSGQWQPARTVSFVVQHPKVREIHAPAFADRIVHHLLVERLEKFYEPIFIHDSYANRQGKGSHAAVDRLQQFMRQRNDKKADGQNGGWFLQLDIHNYFNSIHRPTLYNMLCQRLYQMQQRHVLPASHALALRSLCHKILAEKVLENVRDPHVAALLPPHKRLCNSAAGCGLPVGNLTSQFFANVYLNALDQFVKHTLKAKYYVRYVDDFVLLADTQAQLERWKQQISAFLEQTLHLRLKLDSKLAPITQGVDFLGYVVYAHHKLVRQRVVQHCKAKLAQWQRERGCKNKVNHTDFGTLQALVGSYWGHFEHADSVRLRQNIFDKFVWLEEYFKLHDDGAVMVDAPARWTVLRHQNINLTKRTK
jgi:RNA-directed DNA polymerase